MLRGTVAELERKLKQAASDTEKITWNSQLRDTKRDAELCEVHATAHQVFTDAQARAWK
jgi:hypothetical protein